MSSRMSILVVTVTLVALFKLPCVCAQVEATATCLSQFSWMENSKSQSPCLVAAYLQSACTNGKFDVVPLPVGAHYTGPSAQQANSCQCSTVTFSMISACGICQDRTASPWSGWRTNCTTVHLKEFTETIPADTAVPAWAYLDVVTSDKFDPVAAQAVASAPESTGIAPSGSKKIHIGAIVGCAVGGVVVLCLILGAIVFFIRRRRRRQIAPSAAYDSMCKNEHANSPIPSPLMSHAYVPSSNGTRHSFSQPIRPKLYDPSDPSTFPSAFHSTFPSTLPSTSPILPSPSPPSTDYTGTTKNDSVLQGQSKTHPGQYNYVPEL